MPFLVTFQKLAVEKGAAKDANDMKEKGKRMAGPLMKWIKAHFDELQFYSLETYMMDGADLDDKYKDVQFAANMAMVRYEGASPYFYFIKDAYTEVRPAATAAGWGGERGARATPHDATTRAYAASRAHGALVPRRHLAPSSRLVCPVGPAPRACRASSKLLAALSSPRVRAPLRGGAALCAASWPSLGRPPWGRQ